MQRFLPALAAFALVIAGVGGAILLLASRDHSSLREAPVTAPIGTSGPYGLPKGNVVVTFSAQPDRAAIDQLAATLGAIDTVATREAGQALVSKKVAGAQVVATNGSATLTVTDASDPRLAAFVRQYLGRTTP